MARSFNLVDKKFIPCRWLDGRDEDATLREALLHAPEIREIRDDSPLVTIALHRLLLAILHRTLGPPDLAAWGKTWAARRFDPKPVGEYLDKWRHRFDICDTQRPFYQDANVPEDAPVASLAWVVPHQLSGDNAMLFNHSSAAERFPLQPNIAARFLITVQSYSLGGFGPGRCSLQGSPLVRPISFLCAGESLFETLWLNAITYPNPSVFPVTQQDRPSWEADKCEDRTIPNGYLDYLTWQSRRIQLICRPEDPILFDGLRMLDGLRLDQSATVLDPMWAVETSQDGNPLPRSFHEGRGLWRDSHVLFGQLSNRDAQSQRANRPPLAMLQCGDLEYRGLLARSGCLALMGFGQVTHQAKIELQRHETLPVPLPYLRDENLRAEVADAVTAAESAGDTLGSALRPLVLRRIGLDRKKKLTPDDRKLVSRELEKAMRDYWGALEADFRSVLLAIPDADTQLPTLRSSWRSTVSTAAFGAFHRYVEAVSLDLQILRSLYASSKDNAGAEVRLRNGLRRLVNWEQQP